MGAHLLESLAEDFRQWVPVDFQGRLKKRMVPMVNYPHYLLGGLTAC